MPDSIDTRTEVERQITLLLREAMLEAGWTYHGDPAPVRQGARDLEFRDHPARIALRKLLSRPSQGGEEVERLVERIANGGLESQAEQNCQHSHVSSGGGLSGICLDCGDDLMVSAVEADLAALTRTEARREGVIYGPCGCDGFSLGII